MSSLGVICFFGTGGIAHAADEQMPFETKMAYESLSLPGSESMQMLGFGVEKTLSEHFSAGVGTWTAVGGQRGGFITIGIQGSGHVPIAGPFELEGGAFIGAGGGRGGYTLSGSGLMVRAYAGVSDNFGDLGRLGAGISYVDFPNGGTIDSVQPVVFYSLPFGFKSSFAEGMLLEESSLSVVSKVLMVNSGVQQLAGAPQDDVTLVGIAWRGYLDENWYVKFETEGATGGSSSGYMQILLGSGVKFPLSERLSFDGSISLGGGGGGDVDTGGGLLFDVSGGLQYAINDDLFAGAGLSWLQAPNGDLEGISPSIKIGSRFGGYDRKVDELPVRLRVVSQRYTNGADGWRTRHEAKAIDNLGVQFDYFLVPWAYLTGQGLAAYGGDAGAYMIGLIGAGLHQQIVGPLFAEVEGLAGAAGGGGLDVGSGFVWQANAGIGYQLSKDVALMVTGGRIDAVNGDFAANVLGLSLVFGDNK